MKFTILEQAWLEGLGVFEPLPTLSPAEQESWKVRARAAAVRVQKQFYELQRSGKMREVTQAYKLHRAMEEKPMSWNNFAKVQQVDMIKGFASEQIRRAARGEAVE
jgi:hypothetical protein